MCKVCAAVGLGVVVAGIAFAGPVKAADCAPEVTAAFEKQRKTKGFRMSAETKGDQGPVAMQVDYVLPDRMHQTVRHPSHKEPLETIAIGRWAWGTMGGGWEELQPQFAQAVTAHMRQTLAEPIQTPTPFTCLGKVAYDGKDYIGYRSSDQAPASQATAPPDKGPGAATAAAASTALARTVYVDPVTGLPIYNIVAETTPGKEPVFKGVFSYPADIKIDAPLGEPK